MAYPSRLRSLGGAGGLFLGLGLLSLLLGGITFKTWAGPILFGVLGFWLLVLGREKSSSYRCSECGTKLAGFTVKGCPGCNKEFPAGGC